MYWNYISQNPQDSVVYLSWSLIMVRAPMAKNIELICRQEVVEWWIILARGTNSWASCQQVSYFWIPAILWESTGFKNDLPYLIYFVYCSRAIDCHGSCMRQSSRGVQDTPECFCCHLSHGGCWHLYVISEECMKSRALLRRLNTWSKPTSEQEIQDWHAALMLSQYAASWAIKMEISTHSWGLISKTRADE